MADDIIRAKARERLQQWRKANPEKYREQQRRFRAKDPEATRAYQRNWRLLHPRIRTEKDRENQRRRRAANPQKAIQANRKYQQNNREIVLQSQRAYVERNKERLRIEARERARERRAENPEPIREAGRRWRRARPEEVRAQRRNRRASKIPVPGEHTAQDIIHLYKAQNGQCAGCKTAISNHGELRYHIDHIKPLRPRKGDTPGSNGPENLQLLCRFCNQTKHNMSMEEWLRRRVL